VSELRIVKCLANPFLFRPGDDFPCQKRGLEESERPVGSETTARHWQNWKIATSLVSACREPRR